jgi:hypothetical protein
VGLVVLGLTLVAVGAVAWQQLDTQADGETSATVTSPVTSSRSIPPTVSVTDVPAADLVRVDEAWLLDGENGTYDWGVSVVAVDPAQTRSNVVIDVRLIAASGEVVATASRVVDGIDSDSSGLAIGRVSDSDIAPVRLEFDVSVGVVSDDPAVDELIEVQSVARDGDDLNVRVRVANSTGETDSSGVEAGDTVLGDTVLGDMVLGDTVLGDTISGGVVAFFVWRTDGDVAAVAFQPVALAPAGETRITVDLAPFDVPDRLPDDVLWAS